jgi:hypothetical protein
MCSSIRVLPTIGQGTNVPIRYIVLLFSGFSVSLCTLVRSHLRPTDPLGRGHSHD